MIAEAREVAAGPWQEAPVTFGACGAYVQGDGPTSSGFTGCTLPARYAWRMDHARYRAVPGEAHGQGGRVLIATGAVRPAAVLRMRVTLVRFDSSEEAWPERRVPPAR